MMSWTKNRKGMLDIITTAILLVTFIIVIIFLSVSIALMTLRGDVSGKVLLKVSVGSIYDEERNIVYLTDEYGNKLTDMIGEAMLLGSPEIIVPGNPALKIPAEAINNAAYTCPAINAAIGTYDSTYAITKINLNQYIHCYVIPKKIGKRYGKERYCLSLVYDEGGAAEKKTVYGNDTLDCAGEKKITAEIAPPPGFNRPIYLRMKRT